MGRSGNKAENNDGDEKRKIAKRKDSHELTQTKSLAVFNIFEVSTKQKASKKPTFPNAVV
jgi:hypothetical protein